MTTCRRVKFDNWERRALVAGCLPIRIVAHSKCVGGRLKLAYDAFGGMIKGVSYEWDQHGRPASRTLNAFDFTYRDGNGMLTAMSLSGNPADQRVEQHYRYDSAGRMVGEQLNGEQVASYSYKYLDKVVSVIRSGQRTDIHYNASGMLIGKSQSGSRLESWQWHGLALVARGDQLYLNEDHATGSTGSPQVGGAALMSRTVGGKDEQFLMTDYLGTTLGAVDADGHHSNPQEGTEIGRANFVRTSFGDGAAAPSASERFTGKPYDAELGAHVFPYRNYRADLGRWMSADPINFPDGPNQHYYAPVPTMGVDPWGLASQDGEMTGLISVDYGTWIFGYRVYFDVKFDSVQIVGISTTGLTGLSVVILGFELDATTPIIKNATYVDEEIDDNIKRTWTVEWAAVANMVITLIKVGDLIRGIDWKEEAKIFDEVTFEILEN